MKIDIPDGYCDVAVEGTEVVFLKEGEQKPKNWETAYRRYSKGHCISYIDPLITLNKDPELEPFIALIKLRIIRKIWIGDWEATSDNNWSINFTISYGTGLRQLSVNNSYLPSVLTFPTKEMAEEFLKTFADLIWETESLYD